MGVFVGKKNKKLIRDTSFGKIKTSKIFGIRDTIGAKKANVYFYEKPRGEGTALWKQILPTPYVRNISLNEVLQSGGSVQESDLYLNSIPKDTYDRSQLETATLEGNVDKYWVINQRAYTTVNIKEKLFSFNVQIRRLDSINVGDLINPEEDDMGLTQDQVDQRINELVSVGALKTSSEAKRDFFIFSKTFNLNLPRENENMIFERTADGLYLSHTILALSSPVGTVPNIVDPSQGGGPWGIRFDDCEFSTDAMERIFPEVTGTFPYDAGNHEYELTLPINAPQTTALFEYVQLRETDQQRAGRFFVTWPARSQSHSLGSKTIKALRVKVGNNDAVDIALNRDTTVTNAFAMVSDKLPADPQGLSGNSSVTMTFNFVFTDDTLAYGDNGEVFYPVVRDADLKLTWQSWAGPDLQSLVNVANIERFYHDFETTGGYDIDLNTYNFMQSLTGDQVVQGNNRRMNSVNQCRFKLDIARHDKQQWDAGKYRCKVHRQQAGAQPYLHDFQYKKGVSVG